MQYVHYLWILALFIDTKTTVHKKTTKKTFKKTASTKRDKENGH